MAKKGNNSGLLTLTDIHRQTGMSMITLRKYRDQYPDRIPSVGEGRTMKFPKEAVKVFVAIKKEGRAGRSRSSSKTPKASSAAKRNTRKAKAADRELLTMSEIHRQTGLSMITLRKYRDLYPSRIPSVGEGRKMRFYPEAIEVFQEMKKEGTAQRGRKSSAKKTTSKKTAMAKDALLSLSAISQKTGMSMLTLRKYRDQHADRIPSEGQGRSKRFPAEAIEIFEQIKAENMAKRGRRAAGAEKSARKRASRTSDKGFSLKQVAEQTGIAQWKVVYLVRKYLDRIPHFMEGKYRFFPEEALDVFRSINAETSRGSGTRSKQPSTKSAAKGLSLKEVQRRTGIAYWRLNNLVKKYLDHIPHHGEGRGRTYHENAVSVIKKLHLNPPKEIAAKVVQKGKETAHKAVQATEAMGSTLADSFSSLESILKGLEERLSNVEEALRKPFKVSIERDD